MTNSTNVSEETKICGYFLLVISEYNLYFQIIMAEALNCKVPVIQFQILHVLKILNAIIYMVLNSLGFFFFLALENVSSQGSIASFDGVFFVLVQGVGRLLFVLKDYTELEALLR